MGGLFGGTQNNATTQQVVDGIPVQSSIYGAPISLVYGTNRISGNLIWYGDFQATGSSGGGKGGGGGKGQSSTSYSAVAAIGLCEGPIGAYGQFWNNNAVYQMSSPGNILNFFSGTNPQTPWGWLTTYDASESLGYNDLCYVAAGFDLDSTGALPNFNFEMRGLCLVGGRSYESAAYVLPALPPAATTEGYYTFPGWTVGADGYLTGGSIGPGGYVGTGWLDANPVDVVTDLLTNPTHGAGFPPSMLGDLTQMSNYCVANGIYISPAYTSQTAASDMMTEIFAVCNCEAFMSEGVLKVVPYDATNASAYGVAGLVNYVGNNAVQYSLNDDDFIYDSSTDPVVVSRSDQADAYNYLAVEAYNRPNVYTLQPYTAYDSGSVSRYGFRPAQMFSAHCICDPVVAQNTAQRMMQRGLYIRNTYSFTLGWQFCLLEPMDIVEISDSWLGLSNFPVRILSIDEDADGNLAITAEEFLESVTTTGTYASQPPSGYVNNTGISPGNANAPVAFIGPLPLTNNASEVWIATSGSSQYYGGCEIWTSYDGNTYARSGIMNGSNRMGVTTSAFSPYPDPDSTSVLGVNLSESNATMSSGTQAQVDDLVTTLCYVNGEFISYRDATLTSPNNYNLDYFHRGLYGSTDGTHNVGSPFVRCDGTLTQIPINYTQVGALIYIKLRAFNIYGQAYQDLSTCTAYEYTIGTAFAPALPAVSGLELVGQGNNTVFTGLNANFDWRANSSTNSFPIGSSAVGNAGSVGPYFKDYQCSIFDTSTPPKLIRTDYATATNYQYGYADNFDDNNGTPLRTFTLEVWERGTAGQLSQVPATLTVSNPSPPAPLGMYVTSGPSSLLIGAEQPNASDLAGMIIWASTVSGFAPGPANQIYNGSGNSFNYTGLTPYVPVYVYLAFYDTFGSVISQLNLSTEMSGTPTASGVLVVNTLPATGAFVGECVYLTTDQNIYRWNGSAWTTAVTASQITGLIAASQISAIGASQITGLLTASQIASISAAQLTGQITNTQIANNSISTPQLQAGSVSTAALAAGAVTASTIAAGTITSTQIQAGSILSANIAAGTIAAVNIAANTITASQMAAASVSTAVLQAGAVTANTLAAGAVTSVSIATGTIQASNIASGTITATSGVLATAAVGTLTIAGNAVTIPVSNTSAGPSMASASITLSQAGSIQVISTLNVESTVTTPNANLYISMTGSATGSGGSVGTNFLNGSGVAISYACLATAYTVSVSAGTYTFTNVFSTTSGSGVSALANSITVLGTMR